MGQGPAVLGHLGIPPTAQQPRIDPQELTLGALIGEGGFGKVPVLDPPTQSTYPSHFLRRCSHRLQNPSRR